jgi:16S rRNA (guanine(1405)-N(7))-methyltransferase
VKRVVDWAESRYKNPKEVIKEAKNKLHQIYGAYLQNTDIRVIKKYIDQITDDENLTKRICIQILEHHTSSKERIPFMESVFSSIFSITGTPNSILDIACGFNPFAIPFMSISDKIRYYAQDIDNNEINLINHFFEKIGVVPNAFCSDILIDIPNIETDICFVFKTLPVIEQQEKKYSKKLIENLKSKYIVVSFPTKTLCGKNVNMSVNYEEFITNLTKELKLEYQKLTFINEDFYVLKK